MIGGINQNGYSNMKKLKDEFKFFDKVIEYRSGWLSDAEWKSENYPEINTFGERESYKMKYKLNYYQNHHYHAFATGNLIIKGEYLIDNEILGCFILSHPADRHFKNTRPSFLGVMSGNTSLDSRIKFNFERSENFSFFLPYCKVTDPRIAEYEFISKLKK